MSSLIAVIYVWRFVEAAYFSKPEEAAPAQAREASMAILVPAWILIGASLYFGLDSSLTLGSARSAAAFLLENAP